MLLAIPAEIVLIILVLLVVVLGVIAFFIHAATTKAENLEREKMNEPGQNRE